MFGSALGRIRAHSLVPCSSRLSARRTKWSQLRPGLPHATQDRPTMNQDIGRTKRKIGGAGRLGIFWTKLGTSTTVAGSGTVEEIDQFVEAGTSFSSDSQWLPLNH